MTNHAFQRVRESLNRSTTVVRRNTVQLEIPILRKWLLWVAPGESLVDVKRHSAQAGWFRQNEMYALQHASQAFVESWDMYYGMMKYAIDGPWAMASMILGQVQRKTFPKHRWMVEGRRGKGGHRTYWRCDMHHNAYKQASSAERRARDQPPNCQHVQRQAPPPWPQVPSGSGGYGDTPLVIRPIFLTWLDPTSKTGQGCAALQTADCRMHCSIQTHGCTGQCFSLPLPSAQCSVLTLLPPSTPRHLDTVHTHLDTRQVLDHAAGDCCGLRTGHWGRAAFLSWLPAAGQSLHNVYTQKPLHRNNRP
ncbi:hypothetical protein DM02DRAFT_622336 [Periconia macrospinosa]|uniref:Uncharacterized protein n=1 Tax=Periconia macrospinosa TaxID=97972 RepID=A0A2V1EA43_9PLEO|nr:hypothetical protein DM02DRAFT_622336 [Periconia macrospinosa]